MDRNDRPNLNRELGDWLRDESSTRAPGRLVENVFAHTTRTRQVRRWWPFPAWRRSTDAPARPRLGLLATVAGVLIVVAAAGLLAVPRLSGPGSTPPAPTPTPTGSSLAEETPRPMALDGSPAQVVSLAQDAFPIDVVSAFGSIWVASLHANSVDRIDPATMRVIARIRAGAGPAWFVVAEGAVWVTDQTGQGVIRIDPDTNRAVTTVGRVAPCGRPAVAFGSIWAVACDDDQILQIDPATATLVKTLPAFGHSTLVVAGAQLIASGPSGLATLDPATGTFSGIGACCGDVIGSDGTTVWTSDQTKVQRVDPADGRVLATFPYRYARGIAFASGHAWLTVSNVGVLEIDLATNRVIRTLPLLPDPTVPLEADGVLWVTDMDRSELWRIVP